MKSPMTILITGTGSPGVRGTLYALRNNSNLVQVRIIGVDAASDPVGKFFVDAFHRVPFPEDPQYIEALLAVCQSEGVNVVLPQTTREVAALSRRGQEIEQAGFSVVVGSARAIKLANNKLEVMQSFDRLGFPRPEHWIARSEQELVDAVRKLGYPLRPVAVKPPVSNGMRGFRILRDNAWNLERFLHEKPDGSEVSLDNLLSILRSGKDWPEMLVMEYVDGPEYSVDAFIGSRTAVAVPRLRESIRSGISFQNQLEHRKDLIDFTLSAGRELGLRYMFGFQYKIASNGTPMVLECNPRVQGTMVASVLGGVNVIWMAIQEALGEPPSEFQDFAELSFKRYWGGVGIALGRVIEI